MGWKKMRNLNRREFLGSLARSVGAAAIPLTGCRSSSVKRTSVVAKQPNIILIMADDLGYECLGCYGSTSYKTPFLDELASGGIRFDHCYSQPLCTPSRVKIMTGRYNFRNYTHFGILDPKEKTFGHVLKDAGYATCVAGKWQLYGSVSQPKLQGTGTYPDQAGFDEYCLWQIDQRGSRYADPLIHRNSKSPTKLVGEYGPDVFCNYILDFIGRHRSKPFFVYYPMALVHSPFVPTPDSKGRPQNKGKRNQRYFADMVGYMDKIVGHIVGRLDELGLRENTLILFTADNGTAGTIKSKLPDRFIQGGKGLTTDAGTHVPLIANWTGAGQTGKVCDDLIDFSDFLPTLSDLAGISLEGNVGIDGRSFAAQLQGKKPNPRDWVFCHYATWKPTRFARDKRYKLYDDGRLFDIQADRLESNPIESVHGDKRAAAARKRLQTVLDSIK